MEDNQCIGISEEKRQSLTTTLNLLKDTVWCTECTSKQDTNHPWTHVVVVLCPNSPSASSNTRMASCCLASWKMASMFLVLSPTHLLSSSPQFTT